MNQGVFYLCYDLVMADTPEINIKEFENNYLILREPVELGWLLLSKQIEVRLIDE